MNRAEQCPLIHCKTFLTRGRVSEAQYLGRNLIRTRIRFLKGKRQGAPAALLDSQALLIAGIRWPSALPRRPLYSTPIMHGIIFGRPNTKVCWRGGQ